MKRLPTHFFLALPIPKEIAVEFAKLVQEKVEDVAFKTWVLPEDYHITLHFLGHASEDQLQKINHSLPELIKSKKSFELEITQFGTFGEPQLPRILWTGVREESSLFSLQEEIGTICKQAGFILERRPYRPHITLARKWQKETPFSNLHLLDEIISNRDGSWKWWVKEVVLYQTHMDRLPKYEAVYRYPLA